MTILVPLIINTKVKINAFVSNIGIILGGGIARIAGMFLAIPVIAMLKIIYDRIESMEAWGYLMGDHLPKTFIWKNKKSTKSPVGSEDNQLQIISSTDTCTEPKIESNPR